MKRTIAYLVIIGVLSITVVTGFKIYQKLLVAEVVKARIFELPEFGKVLINGTTSIDSLSNKATIISYINTNCRFCLAEIESIRQHPSLSNESRILLISDEPKKRLELFARSFGLDTLSIEMVWDSSGAIKTLYDINGVPSTFIYGRDEKLLERFKGETNAEMLYELVN